MIIKWQFSDPATDEVVLFEINPKSGGSPRREKELTFNFLTTQNFDGMIPRTIMYEGSDPFKQIDFSGTIYSEGQYNMIATWFQKRYPIVLTDDLERSYKVLIKKFGAKREISRYYPWKHSYDVTMTVLEIFNE